MTDVVPRSIRCLGLLMAMVPLAAAKPPVPTGDLALDMADPVVAVTMAGVPLRLRVDPAAGDAVDLNPDAAARLPVRWQADEPVDVGRVRLQRRAALADMRLVDGRSVPVQLADVGHACCDGVDGAVPPGLLPFATITWRRPAAPEPTVTLVLPLTFRPEFGYEAEGGAAGVRVRFDPFRAEAIGTAAAGAALAHAWGARWAGPPGDSVVAFGISRPVRPIAFDQPGRIAGFPLPRLIVRLADFAGHGQLPSDPPTPDEIVVSRRVSPQQAWPAVTLGAEQLDRCREMRFTARPLALTLRCTLPA